MPVTHSRTRRAYCRVLMCDCPAEYGPSTTVYNRFNRWSRRGFWLKLLDTLVDAGAVTRSTAIDSTYVKAQRSAFGGNVWPGPSARGLNLVV
jgi:transposase